MGVRSLAPVGGVFFGSGRCAEDDRIGVPTLPVRPMRFARRIRRGALSPSVALAGRVRELRARGVDIINFGTRPDVPQHVKRAAVECLDSGASSAYTDVRGLPELRRAIVDKLARENALDVDADREVIVTAGAKQAVFAAVMALADRGDEVLVEDPGWVSFAPIVDLAGAAPVPVPLGEDKRFILDAADLRERITPATRALLLCNPHNPTGAVHDEHSLKAIADVVSEHDLVVVADESYERLVYDGRRHVSIASLPGMRERTVTVQTTSKVYNMAGWRIGWLAAPAELVRHIVTIQSNTITCPTSFAQAGAAAALRVPVGMGDRPITDLARDFAARRDTLVTGLRAMPGVRCVNAGGGLFVFPRFSGLGIDSASLSRHLLDDGVATVPGSAFGDAGEGHLRLLFASPVDEIEDGLERIAQSLASLETS